MKINEMKIKLMKNGIETAKEADEIITYHFGLSLTLVLLLMMVINVVPENLFMIIALLDIFLIIVLPILTENYIVNNTVKAKESKSFAKHITITMFFGVVIFGIGALIINLINYFGL
ncbi:MAG: hypothetical protein IJS47_00940 [Clostridia bacterium]|nr:hypothetical protein [Clostridia bacterium]